MVSEIKDFKKLLGLGMPSGQPLSLEFQTSLDQMISLRIFIYVMLPVSSLF